MDFVKVPTAKKILKSKENTYPLSKKNGETSYSPSSCTKKIQSFVVFTLIFIEIIL